MTITKEQDQEGQDLTARLFRVADPLYQRLVLYRLDEDESEWLVSNALPGLRVKATWLWQRPLPDLPELVREAFPD